MFFWMFEFFIDFEAFGGGFGLHFGWIWDTFGLEKSKFEIELC